MIRRLLTYTIITLFSIQAAQSATCLPEWKYRSSVTIGNSNATAYTDYQVKIIVNTQALISAGKMNPNGDDLRFTDANCNNLHYWIDSNINTTTTVIWVKVNSVAASGNTTIQMYYGNYCATPAQNGDSTFILFDDFNGSSINSSKWSTAQVTPANCTVNVGSSSATFTTTGAGSDNIIRSVNAFAGPLHIETKVRANTGEFPSIALLNTGTYTGVSLFTGGGALFLNFFHTFDVSAGCASYGSGSNSSAIARANGVWGLNWTATNTAMSTFPGGTQTIAATPAIAGSQHAALGIMCTGVGSMSVDWCRLRSYAPTELTSTVNSEVAQNIVQVSFSPKVICPGAPLTVLFSKSNIYFNSGNTFSVELSDASGSFVSPIVLGTISDTLPDTVVANLAKTITPGNGYRIRISSSNPSFTCFTADTNLSIVALPSASFSVLDDGQCFKGNLVNFNVSSTISSGTIDTSIWDWGDFTNLDTLFVNSASHAFNPFFTAYYPKLISISSYGCRDTASTQVDMIESPVVYTKFNDTIQCFKGNRFIIQSETVVSTGSIATINWELGDGSPTVTGTDSFVHSYANPGIYQIRQINIHSNGCADTGFLACLVNVHPNALITTNDTDQCLDGNRFIFEANSTITNGLPLLNYWNIGDNIEKDEQDSVQNTYPSESSRTVQLITISDDGIDGCSDTVEQIILVNPMPTADIKNVDLELCLKSNVFNFTANSTVAYGSLIHSWDFGDMSAIVSNLDTVQHSYTTDGTYTIQMNVVTDKGCTDSATTTVDVRPSPLASFTIDKDTQCFKYNLIKAFSNSTINSGTITKKWALSDGIDFIDVDSISHSFASFGNYNIELIVTSDFNCKDTVSDSVYILPVPLSSFTIDDVDQCLEGNNFTFTDNSVFSNGTLTGNEWSFGDGTNVSNIGNTTHSYLIENDYVAGLIVFADNGCFDTSFQNLKVYPHPGTDFIIDDTGQCVNDNVFNFINNTFISEGGFVNRYFFGDGSPYAEAYNTSKTYTKDSTYLVRLISYSDQGCTDTAEKTLTVFPKAITNFTIDLNQQCILNNVFNFNSTTTLKSGTYTLGWLFGDGLSAGDVAAVQHSYNNVQTYSIQLLSTTNEGCKDTSRQTVKTLPMPVADFNFNTVQSCLKNNDFQFNASSKVSNSSPMNHNWYFGDNDSTINSNFAQHSYLNAGDYTVTLITKTNIGSCADTIDKIFRVFEMPVASFTIDDDEQCFKDNLFAFNSTSSVASGTIAMTNWTFGDNTTSSVTSPNKSYTKVDSFRISLIVTTDNGCIDSIADRVYVYPMPVASFSISPASSCLIDNEFSITPNSSINKGVISVYRYYYGNGDSSILQSPLPYSYPVSGNYIVSHKVTSDKGCWDTTSRFVSINPNPEIDFDVDPVCLKDSSYFINNSTIASGVISSWKWIFGDGKVSTFESPSHKYRYVGSYDITLIGVTDKGCVDTIEKIGAAIVNPNPKAGFYYQKVRSWENEVDIQYIDTSSSAISWNWNFSKMGTSMEQNPKLFYDDTLTQVTTLVVSNNFGCNDTVYKILFIAPDVVYYMPNAFTPNDDNFNETFKPVGLAYAINYKFIIFNRWGEILFRTDNPQFGWDGKYGGEVVEQDLYFYRLEFVGVDELRHEEKGSIMILR
jgi:gliding motility-associated-like protein